MDQIDDDCVDLEDFEDDELGEDTNDLHVILGMCNTKVGSD